MIYLTLNDICRFWEKVDKFTPFGPEGDCWEWQAAKSSGYGVLRFGIKK